MLLDPRIGFIHNFCLRVESPPAGLRRAPLTVSGSVLGIGVPYLRHGCTGIEQGITSINQNSLYIGVKAKGSWWLIHGCGRSLKFLACLVMLGGAAERGKSFIVLFLLSEAA